MITNNFKPVADTCRDEKPPYLNNFDTIEGYEIFSSSFNPILYVIYDHVNNQYCCYEYSEDVSNVKSDLKALIINVIKSR